MILAGFDLATTSGVAFMDGDKLVNAFAYRAKGAEDAEVFGDFRKWFALMLTRYGVSHAAIEQPLVTNINVQDKRKGAKPGEMHNPVTMKTYLRLYGLRAHAVEICKTMQVPVIECHQSAWRKSFTGNGRASKEETLKLAQRLLPRLESKDAAEAVGIVWHLSGVLHAAQLYRPDDLFFERAS